MSIVVRGSDFELSEVQLRYPTLMKKRMLQLRISANVLSRLVGVSRMSIARYAEGERYPDFNVAIRIAEVLKVLPEDIPYLFTEICE